MDKYISLDNLGTYDGLIKALINTTHAQSIQTVMLSQDSTKLLFYKESEPLSQGASPAFEIVLPHQNLDALMRKVITATEGHIAVFNSSGSVVDGSVSINDLVTTTDLANAVNTAIAAANILKAQIVQQLPAVVNANPNVIYMIKDNNVASGDAYKEYLLINGQFEMIGDTSIDLTNYVTNSYLNDRLSALNIPDLQAASTAEIQQLFV